ncbi:MAG: orotidine-5'-phosphate decarboxylase [Oceanicoccus sp.]|jgi:orotidine-5'-phosphate decarboxylase
MTKLENFADKLIEAIKAKDSVVCVGLDPRLERIPQCIMREMAESYEDSSELYANAVLAFNKGIIDEVKDHAVMVKPQSAFYENLGYQGIWALEETCKYAQDQGLLVLLDAKRGDIGSTAEAYAKAYLGEDSPVDALTVNAYLGADGIMPFLDECGTHGKGIFVLVKTSNPSSGDLQDRITADEEMSIAELMGHFVETWGFDHIGENGYHVVGAVVGATYPKEAAKLRKTMPHSFFLVPGYGAQGGAAEDVRPCFDENGLGAIVSSSRGIIFAYENIEGPEDGSHYASVAREATIAMKEALNLVRKS